MAEDVAPPRRRERTGGLAYALYANESVSRPTAYLRSSAGDLAAVGTTALPLNAWTHLAMTYDGTTLRLFVDGGQVGTRAVASPQLTSTGALRFGGNTIWGEYFTGRIDEIRIYNRVLSQTEIQNDRNTAVGP